MSKRLRFTSTRWGLGALVIAGLAAAGAEPVDAAAAARAEMRNASGESVGSVELRETPHGVLLHARLVNMPPGVHAFHVHEVGLCEPPFTSAGGHFNPEERKHGILSDDGMHAGDMPNIHVPDAGALEFEVLNTLLRLDNALFEGDGASIVIHEGADDYVSDPAGHAGPRIACGVITR